MYFIVVEDDPSIAEKLSMTPWGSGYFRTTANTIETGLFELKHSQIDAVLLDINLPGGDDAILALQIRKNHMPVSILVASGNSEIDNRIITLSAGADGY